MNSNIKYGLGRAGLALATCLILASNPAPARANVAAPTHGELQQFIVIGGLLCTEAPAHDCVDHGWRFADANEDGLLDAQELAAVRGSFLEWSAEVEPHLTGRNRMILTMARGLARTVPLSSLVSLYDSNDDGRLSRGELLADVELDERPLATILMDREATDWSAIRARLGQAATFLSLLGLPE